ncbi:ethylene-responsive transcription factor ERF017 [Corylus avellana]|uniref:ethylene-responsive transcription factor ERF017 n=1 Tax=Corylus avellana TaxID=13451 RepID=UPI001E1FFAE2|nr:ethylene-responsive transcription factor ERF017 [Corylus avellana]
MVKQTSDKPAAQSDLKYKGVRKRKWGKYVSEIRLPNSRERIWLGSYDSAEKAARAFDAAQFCLRGRTARFNFPDNPPDIAGGRSLTPPEIQAAAARFANSAEPPRSSNSDRSATETLPTESPSPSPSVSEGTVQMDSELTADTPFSDLFRTMGSVNVGSDYGIFPGFDDFTHELYAQPLPSYDYGEENFDGIVPQDSFLWNF